MTAIIASFPTELVAPGASEAPFVDALALDELPEGALRRVTFGDLDVLLAHASAGIVAVDDRCPHMSAPLSLGELDGCVVGCPLHRGRFDLCSGDVVRMPTTGGLLPDGTSVPVWTPEGQPPKVDVPGLKADARRLTRVRRLRYYPLRVRAGRLEIRIPPEVMSGA
ncbi:MAG TPA: Rieske 2Fe-2S domain-containing protein [Candidatus Deferrimicrobiaceae bacterium]|nr:Rieske 2Fe-2S domain-containing protein [Candidatus Deferrimicrobiaceae bacterium]